MPDTLSDMIRSSRRAVFFGGAGVSTESGIPDFRSEDGAFRAARDYGAPPETLLSHGFLYARPEAFFAYYYDCLVHPEARPNAAHRALAALERVGRLAAVITQNIDGLHQAAGSRAVVELHGSVERNYCVSCRAGYDFASARALRDARGVPRCAACGAMVRPDVTLYGERLDDQAIADAVAALGSADLLIVGGTSLSVYPAVGLLDAFPGENIALINKTPTPMDGRARLVVHGSVGEALGEATRGYA